jgi:hypothetical protein
VRASFPKCNLSAQVTVKWPAPHVVTFPIAITSGQVEGLVTDQKWVCSPVGGGLRGSLGSKAVGQ